MIDPISISSLKVGSTIILGKTSLSEKEIIEYATTFDPLPFHINKEAGKKSIFKRIIASGPHIFTKIHKEFWIPRFGHSVVCGIEVNNWKFLKPTYPETEITGIVEVKSIEENIRPEMKEISWYYSFLDENQEAIQTLELKIMHHSNDINS